METNALHELIERLWTHPTLADLWALQAPLLAINTPAARAAHELAGKFCCYLTLLESKLTSQHYSQLAAILATGAVTTVALKDMLAEGRFQLQQLVVAGMSGVLEVMSAAQHVQAWRTDTRTADLEIAWDLYAVLWELSAEMQPDLPHAERAAHLTLLLAPLRAPDTPDTVRALFTIRLFQMALAARLLPLLTAMQAP